MTPWEKVSDGWAGLCARVQDAEETIAQLLGTETRKDDGDYALRVRVGTLEDYVEQFKSIKTGDICAVITQKFDGFMKTDWRYWVQKVAQALTDITDLRTRVWNLEERNKLAERVSAPLDISVLQTDIKRLQGRLDALEQGKAVSDEMSHLAKAVDKFEVRETQMLGRIADLEERSKKLHEQHQVSVSIGQNLNFFQEAQARQILQHESRLKALETTAGTHGVELPSLVRRADAQGTMAKRFNDRLERLEHHSRLLDEAGDTSQELSRLNRWVTSLARDLSALEGRVSFKEEALTKGQAWAASPVGPSAAATPVNPMTMPDEARATVQQANQQAIETYCETAGRACEEEVKAKNLGGQGVEPPPNDGTVWFRDVWYFPDEGRYWMERESVEDSARVLLKHKNRFQVQISGAPRLISTELLKKLLADSNRVCPYCQQPIEVDLNGLQVVDVSGVGQAHFPTCVGGWKRW